MRLNWELERFLVMLPWFASESDAPEGLGFVFLRDGGEQSPQTLNKRILGLGKWNDNACG